MASDIKLLRFLLNLMQDSPTIRDLNDPQLACMPIKSAEGQAYLSSMAATNFAFVNRSAIAKEIRSSFEKVFMKTAKELDMFQVYDVAHNIATVEDHVVNGGNRNEYWSIEKDQLELFPPGHPDLPEKYKPADNQF